MSDCCNEFEFTSPQGTFYMDGGIRGKDGVTFYPHVSAAGVLSWTNDGGKQNPDPVDIKGADGKSAYAAAQEAGFTGTEQEFNAYLSGIGELTDDVDDLKSAFKDSLISNTWTPNIVKGNYIKDGEGTSKPSSKYARTALIKGYRTRTAVSVSDSTYEFALALYDDTAVVVGATGYISSTPYSTGIHYIPKEGVKFGISFRRVDQAELSDDDISAIVSALTLYSPTDTTLSIAFAAADAKTTGDAVGALRRDFNRFETRNVLQTQLVRNQYIKGSGDGAGTPVTGNNFVRTKTLIAGYGEKISIELTNPTYEYYVSYYGENGSLDGTDYVGYSGYNTDVFVIPEQAKKIGITFRRVDQGELTSDALTQISNSLYFHSVTDTSLSLSGKAADAKATGIAVDNSGIYWSHDTNYLIRTYDALIAKYDELCLLYPQYITKNTLTSGNFTNYEYVLTIGDYNSQNGYRGQDAEIAKPTILISSGVHGYEQSSVMGLYGFVKAMCENVTSLNKIIYAAEYRIIPIACPSGYTNDSRVNSNGVNINRNFATTNWTLLPTGDDYSGAEPADQPETKVMQAWIEDHNDALLYIDWHNSGRLNEISCLLGINTTETAKWKKKYLTSINRVIPWWMKGRNIPPTNIYEYTGGPTAGYSNTGTAVTYAREHNIETAFVLETSWNVIDSGKHSKFSLGVGLEAFANMMIGFADLINDAI